MHTVTQAFRHSLAHTNTISVNFHYMVLGWISGLETHQISTQGALPPCARYCFSATMLNCFPVHSFTIAQNTEICTYTNKISCTYWCTSRIPPRIGLGVRWNRSTFHHYGDLHVNFGVCFRTGSCLRSHHTPPHSSPSRCLAYEAHMQSCKKS